LSSPGQADPINFWDVVAGLYWPDVFLSPNQQRESIKARAVERLIFLIALIARLIILIAR